MSFDLSLEKKQEMNKICWNKMTTAFVQLNNSMIDLFTNIQNLDIERNLEQGSGRTGIKEFSKPRKLEYT